MVLLGRRGPAQVAFTNPELLELGRLRRAAVIVDPAQLKRRGRSGRARTAARALLVRPDFYVYGGAAVDAAGLAELRDWLVARLMAAAAT